MLKDIKICYLIYSNQYFWCIVYFCLFDLTFALEKYVNHYFRFRRVRVKSLIIWSCQISFLLGLFYNIKVYNYIHVQSVKLERHAKMSRRPWSLTSKLKKCYTMNRCSHGDSFPWFLFFYSRSNIQNFVNRICYTACLRYWRHVFRQDCGVEVEISVDVGILLLFQSVY